MVWCLVKHRNSFTFTLTLLRKLIRKLSANWINLQKCTKGYKAK